MCVYDAKIAVKVAATANFSSKNIFPKKCICPATFPPSVVSYGQIKNTNAMEAILVTGIVFYGFYLIFKAWSDHSIKRMLIKNNMIDQSEKLIVKETPSAEQNSLPTLKWGLVLLALGIGSVVSASFYPLIMTYEEHYYLLTWLLPGIVLIFASLGFLAYFFISQRMKK